VISTANRSLQVEIHIPNKDNIRANQVAVVKLQDYKPPATITIPVNTLQTDETGKYVMVAAQDKGNSVAHKKIVTIGQSYGDQGRNHRRPAIRRSADHRRLPGPLRRTGDHDSTLTHIP
jgi:multidrug efflux pump subunit AcrA (membrane-fusion protein)